MKNNFGFAKHEILTVIVLIMAVSCFLLYVVFSSNNDYKKFDTLMNNAIKFSNVVTTNIASFHNTETVYLGEAIDEQLIPNIRSPFSSGYCDKGESKVELIDGMPYVTLRCDNYIIEKAKFNDKDNVPVHKVGKWSLKKSGPDDEERMLYNCVVDGKELFDDYYEEYYFVSRINEKFGTDYYFASNLDGECTVKSKKFYRSTEICE